MLAAFAAIGGYEEMPAFASHLGFPAQSLSLNES
jgi:hypothetical protein